MAILTNGKGDVLEIDLTGVRTKVIFHDNDGNSGDATFSREYTVTFINDLMNEYEDGEGDDTGA